MLSYAVVLLAAGGSTRFKGRDKKPFTNLDGRAVWLHSLERFSIRDDVKYILVVVSKEDRELFDRRYRANVAFLSHARMVEGGKERVDSVQNALTKCPADVDFVAVHDTARPCLTNDMVDAVFARAATTGAAVLAAPIVETVKRADNDGFVVETVSRAGLWTTQTPQVFRRQLLLDAYANRAKVQGGITDDAQLVEALGVKVSLVESNLSNIKITRKEDLPLAEAILKSRPKPKDALGAHPFGDDDMWR